MTRRINAGRSHSIEPTCKKWQEELMQVDRQEELMQVDLI